jgi:hypothetical protein
LSLKNLKSVFENLEKFDPTPEKSTPTIDTPESKTMPVSPDTTPFETNGLENMSSEFSNTSPSSPQEVDYLNDIQYPVIPGFNAKFNTPGNTFGVGESGNSKYIDIVSEFQNIDVSINPFDGTTVNFFTDPPEGFTANFNIGGDTYGIGDPGNSKYIDVDSGFSGTSPISPQEVDYLNADQYPVIPGFNAGFNTIGSTFPIGEPGNSKYIGIGSEFQNTDTSIVNFNGDTVNFMYQPPVHTVDITNQTGFYPNVTQTSDTLFNGIAAGNDTKLWDPVTTNYYDSIHTRNSPLDDVDGSPFAVDFLNNSGASGFTLSGPNVPFTTQFQGIVGDIQAGTFLKPTDGGVYDSWDVSQGFKQDYSTISFTFDGDSTDGGVNYMKRGAASDFTSGFIPNQKEDSTTLFDGLNTTDRLFTIPAGSQFNYTDNYNIGIGNITNPFGIGTPSELPGALTDGTLFDPVTVETDVLAQHPLFANRQVTLQNKNQIDFKSFANPDGTSFQFSTLYTDVQNVTENKYTGEHGQTLNLIGSVPNDPAYFLLGTGSEIQRLAGTFTEPYIVSQIGKTGYGDRTNPRQAAVDDATRMANFIRSEAGTRFVDKMSEGTSNNKYAPQMYDPTSLSSGVPILGVNHRNRLDEGLITGIANAISIASGGGGIFETYPRDYVLFDEPDSKFYTHSNLKDEIYGNAAQYRQSSDKFKGKEGKFFVGVTPSGKGKDPSFNSRELVNPSLGTLTANGPSVVTGLKTPEPASSDAADSAESARQLKKDNVLNAQYNRKYDTDNALSDKLKYSRDNILGGGSIKSIHEDTTITDDSVTPTVTPNHQAAMSADTATGNLKPEPSKKADKTDKPFGPLGDPFTLFSTNTHLNDEELNTRNDLVLAEIDKEENGMPFYFKDLRDNRLLIFRAYINGLNESFSPSWESESYIGRSEPAYVYTGNEREVGFSLRLYSQTSDELDRIYEKLNRLTSMTYPEYKSQGTIEMVGSDGELDVGAIGEKIRMKPPLLKFRLGELYGSANNKEVTCFIKSLSYTFPDESTWETKKGKRVPKHIDIDITLQIIHDEVPSLAFAQISDGDTQNSFYGINLHGAPFHTETAN